MAEKPASKWITGGQTRLGLVVSSDAASAWFIREIIPLEPNLMQYLRHNWRNASDIPDLRQEIYARVLKAARARMPENAEQFLFTCARNHLIDVVRHEQVVPMESFADIDVLGIAADGPLRDRLIIDQQETHRLEAALDQLPPRTREAVALAYFDGLSRNDIAKRMGVTHQTVSELVARGAMALADILLGASASRSRKS